MKTIPYTELASVLERASKDNPILLIPCSDWGCDGDGASQILSCVGLSNGFEGDHDTSNELYSQALYKFSPHPSGGRDLVEMAEGQFIMRDHYNEPWYTLIEEHEIRLLITVLQRHLPKQSRADDPTRTVSTE